MTNITKKPLHNGNKGFKKMHLNIISLVGNIDQFRVYASNNQINMALCVLIKPGYMTKSVTMKWV